MRKKIIFLFIIAINIYFLQTNLFAHKVNIFYYIENNKVYLETYFSDGTRCKNSEILVYNKNGDLILKGKTDNKGMFSFPIKKNYSDLKIVLNVEMGHRAETIIKSSEWKDENQQIENSSKSVTSVTDDETNKTIHTYITKEELSNLLDKKLKPILREIALLKQEKPSFSEIIGGIGYIFGIFGIILYFKSRKNDSK